MKSCKNFPCLQPSSPRTLFEASGQVHTGQILLQSLPLWHWTSTCLSCTNFLWIHSARLQQSYKLHSWAPRSLPLLTRAAPWRRKVWPFSWGPESVKWQNSSLDCLVTTLQQVSAPFEELISVVRLCAEHFYQPAKKNFTVFPPEVFLLQLSKPNCFVWSDFYLLHSLLACFLYCCSST